MNKEKLEEILDEIGISDETTKAEPDPKKKRVEILFDNCPRCSALLIFSPISQFDKDGAKLGFQLVCKECHWTCIDRFYSPEDVAQRKAEINGREVVE